MQAIVKGLADPTPFYSAGVRVAGVKYTFLRSEPNRSVYGRQVCVYVCVRVCVCMSCDPTLIATPSAITSNNTGSITLFGVPT